MKRLIATIGLFFCLLALAAGASAQEQLNFADLPSVSTPSPMPNGYGQLDWGNFFFVDPSQYLGAGPGYKLLGTRQDVVFIGSKNCRLVGYTCYGTLSNARGFQLVSATAAAGFRPELITVTAYNNGKLLGSTTYFLNTWMETLTFPSWGIATEVIIQFSQADDNVVLYSVSAYTLGG